MFNLKYLNPLIKSRLLLIESIVQLSLPTGGDPNIATNGEDYLLYRSQYCAQRDSHSRSLVLEEKRTHARCCHENETAEAVPQEI